MGFFDHLEKLEEGFAEITVILTEVTQETHMVTGHTNSFAEQVAGATKKAGAGTASNIKNIAGDFARKLDDYKAKIEKANSCYLIALNKIGSSLEYIVTAQDVSRPGAQEQLTTFMAAFAMIEDGALKGKDSFTGMAETMEKSPKIEKRLNRAIQNAAKEIRGFVVNVDQTVAMVSRARNVGERILRKYMDINKEKNDELA